MSRVALVTGKYRGDEGLTTVVKIIKHGFRSGHLDRVVFSTWDSERDHILRFAKKLPNVTFITSAEPDMHATRKNPIVQSIAWKRAIEQMSDDDVVLKLRTDRASQIITRGLMQTMSVWDSVPRPNLDGGWPKIFERRVVAPYFNPFYAFLIHDIEFLAQASDLRKLATLDLEHLLLYRAPSTEGFFHSAPFLAEIPQVKGLLNFDIRLLFKRGNLRRWCDMLQGDPSWLYHWFTYLQIVRRYYAIGWNPTDVGAEPAAPRAEPGAAAGKRLIDFLLEESEEHGLRNHAMFDGTVARFSWWLDNLPGYLANNESLAREIWEDMNGSFSRAHEKWNPGRPEILAIRSKFSSFMRSCEGEPCVGELYRLDNVETL